MFFPYLGTLLSILLISSITGRRIKRAEYAIESTGFAAHRRPASRGQELTFSQSFSRTGVNSKTEASGSTFQHSGGGTPRPRRLTKRTTMGMGSMHLMDGLIKEQTFRKILLDPPDDVDPEAMRQALKGAGLGNLAGVKNYVQELNSHCATSGEELDMNLVEEKFKQLFNSQA